MPCTCKAGWYGDPLSQCQQCPPNSSSPAESPSLSDCICDPGFTGPDGGPCARCEVGEYKESSGDANCSVCPTGTTTLVGVNASIAITDCVCKLGYEGTQDGAECTPCAMGTFKNFTGFLFEGAAQGCFACPSMSGTRNESSTSITDCICSPGTFRSGDTCVSCPEGTYQDEFDQTACVPCASGTTTDGLGSANISQCICSEGYYGGGGGTSCSPCPEGTYKDTKGNTEGGSSACSACPLLTTSTLGAADLSNCTCVTGAGRDGAASGACWCAAGYYGTTQCNACPSNSGSADNSSSLSDCYCSPGYAPNAGGACTACAVGEYKDTLADDACLACPNGTSTAGTGTPMLTGCVCVTGYEGATDGAECTPCAVGDFKSEIGNGTCASCPGNSSTFEMGATAISDCVCNPGYFAASNGTACEGCPAGSYQPAPAQAICLACPANSSTVVGADSLLNCSCLPGHFGGAGEACTPCAPGLYKVQASSLSTC